MKAKDYRATAKEKDIQRGICQLLDLVGIPYSVTDAGLTVRDGKVVGRAVTTDGWPDVTGCVQTLVPDAMLDSPWPLRDAVETLVFAVEHLFDAHECDTQFHEQFRAAQAAARVWLDRPLIPIGQLWAIETKTAIGKLRPSQVAFLNRLGECGARVCVSRSIEDVARALIKAGVKHQVLTALTSEGA